MISRNLIANRADVAQSSKDSTDRLEDGELLRRFRAGSHEEANRAFAQIVRRHQAVVLGVCRRILNDEHEAEDAFQATFLLLARKSRQVRDPRTLAAWLHRVAFRICLRVRERQQRRPDLLEDAESLTQKERTLQMEAAREACLAIDEELERLPDQQRLFLILCALEGMSYGQVAQRLGVSRNQVKWGLSRARTTLRLRLARRGLAYSACMLAALSSHKNAVAAPVALTMSTAELATRFVYYPATLTVASKPILLAYEGLHVMLLTKIKTALLVSLALTTLGLGSLITIASAAAPHPSANAANAIAQDEDQEKEEARAAQKRARAEAEKQRAMAEEQRRRAEEQLRVAKEQMAQQEMFERQKMQEYVERVKAEAAQAQEQMRMELQEQRKMMGQLERTEQDRRREMDIESLLIQKRREAELKAVLEEHERATKVSREVGGQLQKVMSHVEQITNEQRARTEELSQQVREVRAIQEKILMELRRLRESRGGEKVESEDHSAADVNRIKKVDRQRELEMEARAMAEFKEAQARLEKMRAVELQKRQQASDSRSVQDAQITELKAMIEKLAAADDSDANREKIAALKQVIASLKGQLSDSTGNLNQNQNLNESNDVAVQVKQKMQAMAEQLERLEAEKMAIEAQLRKTAEQMKKLGGEVRGRQ